MPAAQQFFEETFRPAKLLLDVYRLLDNDAVMTEHDWLCQLRPLVAAKDDEELLLIWNGVFLGLVKEAAAFSRVSHSAEEWNDFREAWGAKTEEFAERAAAGDPLAVQVILKAIEKESETPGTRQ